MISAGLFRDPPVLTGEHVELRPVSEEHVHGMLACVSDPEVRRLTGSHATFTAEQLRGYVARAVRSDQVDWAIVRKADGVFLGNALVFDVDPDDESAAFRIALRGAELFDRGYGTEATRLAVDFALDRAGLHRLSLEVYDFNPRAQRVYEKCGFRRETVQREALRWDGEWHDSIGMAVLAGDPR